MKPERFEEVTGYTICAQRKKIERGVWICGKQYVKAPDGHILMDMVGYNEWVEGR